MSRPPSLARHARLHADHHRPACGGRRRRQRQARDEQRRRARARRRRGLRVRLLFRVLFAGLAQGLHDRLPIFLTEIYQGL